MVGNSWTKEAVKLEFKFNTKIIQELTVCCADNSAAGRGFPLGNLFVDNKKSGLGKCNHGKLCSH